MAWTQGDPIPERGTPERAEYNDVRFSDKGTRDLIKAHQEIGLISDPNAQPHPDLDELADWEKNKKAKQKVSSQKVVRSAVAVHNVVKEAKQAETTDKAFSFLSAPRMGAVAHPYRDVDSDPLSSYRPSAENETPSAINTDTRHHDLMHNIGLVLDGHLNRLASTHPDVRRRVSKNPDVYSGSVNLSGVRDQLAKGFEALTSSYDNHFGGSGGLAKAKMRESANHFSGVATALRNHFGKDAVPKMEFGADPKTGEPVFHDPGTLAVHNSNMYIDSRTPGKGAMPVVRDQKKETSIADVANPDLAPILDQKYLEENNPAKAQSIEKEEDRLKRQAKASRTYRNNQRTKASNAKQNTRLWLANGQGISPEEVDDKDVEKFHAAHLNGEINIPDMSKSTAAKNVIGTEVGEDLVSEKDAGKEAETAAKETPEINIGGSSTALRVNKLSGKPLLTPRQRADARAQAFKILQEKSAANTVRVTGVTQYEKARELSRQGHNADEIKSLMELEHGGSEELGESVERNDAPTSIEHIERPRPVTPSRRDLTPINTELEDRQAARVASRSEAFGQANASARGE